MGGRGGSWVTTSHLRDPPPPPPGGGGGARGADELPRESGRAGNDANRRTHEPRETHS